MKRLMVVLAALGLALATGCETKKMNTVGRVTKGGKPYTVPENDFVRIQFVPYTEPGQNPRTCYIADFDNAKGTFKALGPDHLEIATFTETLALAEEGLGRLDTADSLLREAYATRNHHLGDGHSMTKQALMHLGRVSLRAGPR